MVRKNKQSAHSFGNLGLKPQEDDKLINKLKQDDISLRKYIRRLIRKDIADAG